MKLKNYTQFNHVLEDYPHFFSSEDLCLRRTSPRKVALKWLPIFKDEMFVVSATTLRMDPHSKSSKPLFFCFKSRETFLQQYTEQCAAKAPFVDDISILSSLTPLEKHGVQQAIDAARIHAINSDPNKMHADAETIRLAKMTDDELKAAGEIIFSEYLKNLVVSTYRISYSVWSAESRKRTVASVGGEEAYQALLAEEQIELDAECAQLNVGLEPVYDIFGAPKHPEELIECLHCNKVFLSMEMKYEYRFIPDKPLWWCADTSCDGKGYDFDLFPHEKENNLKE